MHGDEEEKNVGSMHIVSAVKFLARVVYCGGWRSESSTKIETKYISHGLLCSTHWLASRFGCAKFRSGVSGIPVSVSRLNSRCSRDLTVCVKLNIYARVNGCVYDVHCSRIYYNIYTLTHNTCITLYWEIICSFFFYQQNRNNNNEKNKA